MLLALSGAVSAAGVIIATGTSTDLRIEVLKYEPAPSEPGALVDLWLKVYTQGGTISATDTLTDVKLSLVEEFPFAAASESEKVKDLGTMSPGEDRTIKFKVKVDSNANPGANEIKFKFTSSRLKDGVITSPFDIEVKSISATIAVVSVESNPEKIPSGEKATVSIRLRNDALLGLRDITAKLDLTSSSIPFAPIHSITEKKIRYLPKGEAAGITYDIIALADAEAKVYKVPFTLTYYDDAGNAFSKNDTIGLIVSTAPDLKVSLEDFDTFQPGKSGKIVVSVANTGPSNIKYMTLRLEPSEDYAILGKAQEYLGNLDSDDFETAEFSVNVRAGPSGTMPVEVLLDYRDSYNEQKEERVTLQLPVYSASEIRAYGLDGDLKDVYTPILIIVGILFLYFSVKDWRKEHTFDSALKAGFEGIFIAVFKVLFLFRWRSLKRMPARAKLFFQKV